jgi:hypothetical protein
VKNLLIFADNYPIKGFKEEVKDSLDDMTLNVEVVKFR